ncbi:hypothetical protein [Streptomyces specialis]|uniref:hypothetical protein n=1 Tax=Streptomyces specialis TaxID=498367 RepID=UPI00131A7C8B|nr:hypothetical protein [Streptomyces specialis]
MAQHDMTARLAAFTTELRAVTHVLDPDDGWFAAFGRRNGEQLQAWLTGRELPPWDAVADLLQDLAGRQGPAAAQQMGQRLRDAYDATTRAEDALPGGRETLTRRLLELDRAQREVETRERQLAAAEETARRTGREFDAERFAALRLWARDDQGRLLSRRAETRARLDALGAGVPETSSPAPAPAPVVKAVRRPRGARFAGLDETAAPTAAPVPVPAPVIPADPETETGGAPPLRGSRFAGAVRVEIRPEPRFSPTPEDHRAALDIAERLRQLRADGLNGAAHVVLCEAASGPPERLPALVAEMERTGMLSDLTTLLWEAATLPPGPLVSAAEALAEAGRERDCGQLLRQGAARPATEAGSIAAELWSAGHGKEAVTLLAALVQARTAEEAARAAATAPEVVVPLLLDAASKVSPSHHYAVTSELRRAGVA